MIREVFEEAGIIVDKADVKEIYGGTDDSIHQTHHSLFVSTFRTRPEISMSWEHSSYEWLDRDEFLEKAKNANDTYMHMVYDRLR
jgi:8-oxo-dGTP pyrophosphatase MutT (NUDIX family)